MSLAASWGDVPVTPDHARYLEEQAAITPAVALAAGLRSATEVDHLPPWVRERSWAADAVPAIVFPWRSPGGRVVEQVRPDRPLNFGGDDHKYLWPKGEPPVLQVARDVPDAETILIVEGTKQALAAASWAGDGLGVFGLGGCRNWTSEGVPLGDLAVADGRRVVVALDADVSTNFDVYSAAMKLAEAVRAEGASEVAFIRLPAAGTTGLDDVLASRPADRRTSYLWNLIGLAKSKPADRAPKGKRRAVSVPRASSVPVGDRPFIEVDRDRLFVINDLTDALVSAHDQDRLFDFGEVLSQRVGTAMKPLTKGTFLDLIQETAATGKQVEDRETGELTRVYGWPDGQTVDAVMSRSRRFSRLDRIARAPFIRPDGTVCQANGYDAETSVMVVMDDALTAINVPETPTAEEVALARKLITVEWLGDLMNDMHSDADRANALALIITPFVRGHMDVVPLAVVDGREMGVGKNLFTDVTSILATGGRIEPLGWNDEDDENRKLITSAFRTGADIFVFDEAHHLKGTAFARALTAATWIDRQLGVSQILGFPNRVTWVSLGNQVRVEGDITRRVYRIAIRPSHPDPKNRPASSFRHEDLRGWTSDHRAELLTAVLTLVRAWFAAGCPDGPRRGFGSFEKWERIVGGILAHAGVTGFLENLEEWRSETSFETRYWAAHLHWLVRTFGERVFTSGEVREALTRDVHSEAPPNMTDLSDSRGYTRALGAAYARIQDRVIENIQLIKVGTKHDNVSAWQVIDRRSPSTSPVDVVDPIVPPAHGTPDSGGQGGKVGEAPTPDHTEKNIYTPRDPRDDAITHDGADAHVSRIGSERPAHPLIPPVPETATNGSETGRAAETAAEAAPPAPPKTRTQRVQTAENALFEPPAPSYETVDLSRIDRPATITLPEGVFSFDLETASKEQLHARPDFIRLGGYQVGGSIRVTPHASEIASRVAEATTIVGHNIMGFDLIALAAHHGLDIHSLVADGRVFDTMLSAILTDPPTARTEIERVHKAFSLNALGDRLLDGTQKATDLKALAAQFGGFDRIPVDDSRYVDYLVQDVDMGSQIAVKLRKNPYVLREHRVAAIAAQIRLNGFRVDVEELDRRVQAAQDRRAELTRRLIDQYGLPEVKADGKRAKAPHATKDGKAAIDRAFADLGVTLARTGGGLPALGKDALKAVADAYADRPDVLALLDVVGSLNGVRTVYETAQHHLVGDRVHPEISMFQASGRWSTTNPGLTVFGKRGGRHVEREIFIPEPGHVIISADLSQVDARAVAAWCQDPAYLDLFEPGRDSHTEIALAVWGDASRRDDAKVLGHGWNYGMGLAKLAAKIGSEDVARQFDRSMKERFPGLVTWKREVAEMADAGVMLDNGFGRKLRCVAGYGWTQGPALVGQAAARDVMMEGLLRLPPEAHPYLRAVVHDEMVLSVPVDQVDDVERAVLAALTFEWCPHPDGRPVRIEAGLGERRGRNWGHVYEKEAK